MNLIEKIMTAKSETQKKGVEPFAIFIHPCHRSIIGDLSEIGGMKILIPSWNELGLIAIMSGMCSEDKAFWNPDNAFIIDRDAYDNLIGPQLTLLEQT